MSQGKLLNFIWLYNEYIKGIEKINKEEREDAFPVQIDEFYETLYPQMIE